MNYPSPIGDQGMRDFQEGIKREVAEIKFLIHDLRVEKFINDVIHFQVTLNTDLEIYNIEQIAQLHSEDLFQLKTKAQEMRKAFQVYSNAVKSFSPPQTILRAANDYIETIQDICELVVNPLWGRFDKVASFLPLDCRSLQAARHYKNVLHWICGVYLRIENFMNERAGASAYREFDIAAEVEDFTANVIKGYVTEKSSSRVDIGFERMDSAVLGGNKHRFRRMLFNLVMNAVDAMSNQQVGVLKIGVARDEETVTLSVQDNGCGLSEEKKQELLSDRFSLDGELHSLGFVFVRQTVDDFNGGLEIESTPDAGTKMTVILPYLKGKVPPPHPRSRCERFKLVFDEEPGPVPEEVAAKAPPTPLPAAGQTAATALKKSPVPVPSQKEYGQLLLNDFRTSHAQFRGSIFAISINENFEVDLFTHRPYEAHWDISHEDLSPMLYEATVRGRMEEDEGRQPTVILKAPHDLRQYLDLKGIDEREFSPAKFAATVRDEYIAITRKLIETGLDAGVIVHATDLRKFFPDFDACFGEEPFALEVLARQKLAREL